MLASILKHVCRRLFRGDVGYTSIEIVTAGSAIQRNLPGVVGGYLRRKRVRGLDVHEYPVMFPLDVEETQHRDQQALKFIVDPPLRRGRPAVWQKLLQARLHEVGDGRLLLFRFWARHESGQGSKLAACDVNAFGLRRPIDEASHNATLDRSPTVRGGPD